MEESQEKALPELFLVSVPLPSEKVFLEESTPVDRYSSWQTMKPFPLFSLKWAFFLFHFQRQVYLDRDGGYGTLSFVSLCLNSSHKVLQHSEWLLCVDF